MDCGGGELSPLGPGETRSEPDGWDQTGCIAGGPVCRDAVQVPAGVYVIRGAWFTGESAGVSVTITGTPSGATTTAPP
jgi:hypothetical protein